ncbi:PREDICTED: RPM1-interacting protein 4-like [Tarenaya hassleriana]|uniref:RPM1-interacting protein 4-like n=1 Tax=Tarenaya hassleriana TaxID=28532 RepID=UPI00053C69EB|nr:PREDICTED: RPM1-interacting protein 4-like [Tarenaya hassleriana]
MAEKGPPLHKFGEWDVNDPASAEGFTVIFNKARNEKKGGVKTDDKDSRNYKTTVVLGKPQSKRWLCCVKADQAD